MRSRNCANSFPSWNMQISAMQQRGLELEGRDRPPRKPHSIQRRTPPRIRSAKLQGAGATSRRPRNAISRREEELASVDRTTCQRPKPRWSSIARRCNRSATPLQSVEDDLRARAGSVAPGAGRCFRAGAGFDAACATKSPRSICRSRAMSSASKNFPRRKSSWKKSAAGWKRGCTNSPRTSKRKNSTSQTTRGSVEERQKRLREIADGTARRLRRSRTSYLQQQAEKRSRLNVLEQLQGPTRRFQRGRAGGVAAVAEHVLGSLADRIRVPDQFVTAIENALGHHLQLVFTEQPESAQQILADLSANKAGRASIAALSLSPMRGEMRRSRRTPATYAHGLERRVVHALNVVQADPSVEPLLETSAWPHVHRARSGHGHRRKCRTATRGCDFVTLARRFAEPSRRLHRRLFERQRQRQGARLHSRPQKPDRRIAGGTGRIAGAGCRSEPPQRARC